MRGYLIRVGIDQAFGQWNSPIDPRTGAFVYVPIPESPGTRFQPGMAPSYAPFRAALDAFAATSPDDAARQRCVPPATLDDLSPHLDPDFDRLTYGDNGLRRGRGLCELVADDFVVFFAGMRPTRPHPERLVYAIIGFYRVAEAVRLRDVPRRRWSENAHTRKLRQGPDDVILRAQPGVSGRLDRAIPIGEFRNGAYRVRRDLLRAWGDISCADGFIQRSAVLPTFRDPRRFLRWFETQSPDLSAMNNPPVSPQTPSAAATASSTSHDVEPPAEPGRVILVHLRQPKRHDPRESRTDPLYEFGSFGLTGCHDRNLLRDLHADGARLGFVQPGPDAMRLVHLTPRVMVTDHGRRREASWSPAEMPLRYAQSVLLIDNRGRSDVRGLRAAIEPTRRSTWVARFASRFRSRKRELPRDLAAALVAAWERKIADAGPGGRAQQYWEALPVMPPCPDADRDATYARLLIEAGRRPRRARRRC